MRGKRGSEVIEEDLLKISKLPHARTCIAKDKMKVEKTESIGKKYKTTKFD